MKIEIRSKDVHTVRMEPREGGRQFKPYDKFIQEGWAHTVRPDGSSHPYPEKIRITLGKPDQAYAPGVYHLTDMSFWVNRFGELELGRLILAASAPQVAKAA